jgi:NDP-sugar pyrophosphorylase family protein/aminoglycoside/choline kinase family phosphotransferase
MKRPSKALLLAAGFGTRLRPLTDGLPKPLLPLWNRPLIDHMLDLLAGWGVRDVLVNLHHAADALLAHLKQPRPGPRITLSFEPAILGTAGALGRAEWFFGTAPFWVANTDIAAALSPRPLLHAFSGRDPLAVLWMAPDRGPRTVEMRDGVVTCFRGARPGSAGTFTFCGLQLVSPRLFRHIEAGRFQTLVDAYERGMAAGETVLGVAPADAFWRDAGTPASYLEAHRAVAAAARAGAPGAGLMDPDGPRTLRRLRAGGVAIDGFAAVARTATVASGAKLHDSVVHNGAVLGAGARVADAVVGRGVRLARTARGVVVRADARTGDPVLRRVLAALHFAADRTAVAALPGRGSARTFERLTCGRRGAMLVRYSLARPENGRFASHARFLAAQGVPVPAVLCDLPRLRAVAVEDLGDVSLGDAGAGAGRARVLSLYRPVLDALLLLHGIEQQTVRQSGVRLEPRFSPALYRWERELFRDCCLVPELGLNARRVRAVMDELRRVEAVLRGAQRALLHRDMQSSNVLLRRGRVFLIDFQGMRWGPPAYDLASLLCDPYVMLPPDIRAPLLDYYTARSPHGDEVRATFRAAAVQRLAQALGAYGRLAALPQTRRFRGHITAGLRMMAHVLGDADDLPHLGRLVRDRSA